MNKRTISHYSSIISLTALILLCLAWETWLAPLRPGGSLLMLKVIPLLFPLFGILRGKVYTYQWSMMLILFYFIEGVVRAWSEPGISGLLGFLEVIFSAMFFFSAIVFIRCQKGHTSVTDKIH